MTGRIGRNFEALKQAGRRAFVAYLTAGDPDLGTTARLITALEAAGVDLIEIGVPFSDPTADGPAIQAASQRALKGGATLGRILALVASLRASCRIPIVLFGYYNPILSHGPERFAREAAAAGVDGILVVDLPPEESAELRRHTDPAGLDFITLVAPTTGSDRARRILQRASGFVYLISVTGVTGTAVPEQAAIEGEIGRLRALTPLPIAVGFGISTPEQAKAISRAADGIVLGSALVRLIAEQGTGPGLIPAVTAFAARIRTALDTAGAP
jgi:tryptophan synthase alpha chain